MYKLSVRLFLGFGYVFAVIISDLRENHFSCKSESSRISKYEKEPSIIFLKKQKSRFGKQKFIFRIFFIPEKREYYSFWIDIIPKKGYNVLKSERYYLCI